MTEEGVGTKTLAVPRTPSLSQTGSIATPASCSRRRCPRPRSASAMVRGLARLPFLLSLHGTKNLAKQPTNASIVPLVIRCLLEPQLKGFVAECIPFFDGVMCLHAHSWVRVWFSTQSSHVKGFGSYLSPCFFVNSSGSASCSLLHSPCFFRRTIKVDGTKPVTVSTEWNRQRFICILMLAIESGIPTHQSIPSLNFLP